MSCNTLLLSILHAKLNFKFNLQMHTPYTVSVSVRGVPHLVPVGLVCVTISQKLGSDFDSQQQ